MRYSALALKQFEISSGFRLPDRSVLSPDAALVHLERREALTPAERLGITAHHHKMAAYQANGAQLGWLAGSGEFH